MTLTFDYIGHSDNGVYNTGTFTVKLTQWSRAKGDTIYVASTPVYDAGTGKGGVVRTHPGASNPPGVNDTIHLRGYDYAWTLAATPEAQEALRKRKGKEPRLYLTSFEDALKPSNPYVEGDVIAIIDTMKLTGTGNVVIHGSDANNAEYATIQIIRYAGSHYQLPGEHGAYRGPMMVLSDTAQLGLFNVWLNGSGFTRNKISRAQMDAMTSVYLYTITDNSTTFGSDVFYEVAKWYRDTLFVNDPMILVKDNAEFNAVSNVRMSNAISRANRYAGADEKQLGAAIAVVKSTAATPQVVLGDNTEIINNAMPNHSFANSLAATAPAPEAGNNGAAVHVSDAVLQIGGTKNGNTVLAHQNYYLYQAPLLDGAGTTAYTDDGRDTLSNGTTQYVWDGAKWKKVGDDSELSVNPATLSYTIPEMVTDTRIDGQRESNYEYWHIDPAATMMWNNVSLVRTPQTALTGDSREMKDAKSNHILLRTTLGTDAKVGVSKWFPGGDPSYPRNIRDTIGFATAPTSPEAARLAYVNGNFFADSMAYGVDTFYHNLVNPYNVYFHRCATFHFRDDMADLYYHWDPDAHCPGGDDSLTVYLKGGFKPYTYNWYGYKTKLVEADPDATPSVYKHFEVDATTEELMRSKTTTATVAHEINNTGGQYNTLLAKAGVDTLLLTNIHMPAGLNVDRYYYEVSVTDLTGCERRAGAMVKMVKSLKSDPKLDSTNYLKRLVDSDAMIALTGNTERITVRKEPGVVDYYELPAGSSIDSNLHHFKTYYYDLDGNRKDTVLRLNDTNLYLRFYDSYLLTAEVMPDQTYGTIYYKNTEGNWGVMGGLTKPENPTTDVLDNPAKTEVRLCYGDEIELKTVSQSKNGRDLYEFMFWSFDPTAPAEGAIFTMPEADATLAAYYAPQKYWFDSVKAHPGENHYSVDYNGTVHIKSNLGLAWFISTVNGLNYQQMQTFVFDTIYLDAADYDMSACLWTPLGNINHPFRGVFRSSLPGGSHIHGLFCDEHELPYVGFFGHLDSARIGNIDPGAGEMASETEGYRIRISDAYFHGHNYVGGLAARAVNGTQIHNVDLANMALNGENAMGGMVGYASNSTMKFNKVGIVDPSYNGAPGVDGSDTNAVTDIERVKLTDGYAGSTFTSNDPSDEKIYYMGSAIYLGGMVGVSDGNTLISNNAVQPHDAMYAHTLYAGGVAGQTKEEEVPGTTWLQRLRGAKSGSGTTQIVNNYVKMQTSDECFRAGGLVGNAGHVSLRNNYAYGNLKSWGSTSGLVAVTGCDVEIEHCFYNSTSGGTGGIGVPNGNPQVSDTSGFYGTGREVKTTTPIDGLDNVTVLLNKYVREQGNGTLSPWRSDIEYVNDGLPIFGTPDTIPVYTYLYDEACDSYEWQGTTYGESGSYTYRSFDPVLLIDSITTLRLTLNHSTAIVVSDSVAYGNDYNAHGFSLTYEEIRRRMAFLPANEVQLLQFTDSLLTEHGCDSVVSLWLTVYKKASDMDTVGIDAPASASFLFDVQVYPNPTLGTITEDSEALQQEEIYDNVSRKVMQSNAAGNKHQMNLSHLSAGAYYVRVTTDKGVAVKKIIKK